MPPKKGSHLTYEERCQIYALLKSGKSIRGIGKLLGRSHSTIIREVKRNSGGRGYRYLQADRLSKDRRSYVSMIPKKMLPNVIQEIQKMLEETQASPEQIAGRLKLEGLASISHESIYRFIWKDKACGGSLYKHLRHRAKKYNKRSAKKAGRGLIPGRIDIEERPEIVDKKERFGDMELDTIVGSNHQGSIVSIVDRATKVVWLDRLVRGTAQDVRKAINTQLKPLGEQKMIHTLTSDNGKEFAEHEQITKAIGGNFYFAKPYHSWERGLNEHTNGLVRQYFPKGTNFATLTQEEVKIVQQKLNNRPRKILNFKTPLEAISRLVPNMPPGALHC